MSVIDIRDFQFLLGWLDLRNLLKRDRFSAHAPDDVFAVLALAEQVATEKLASHLRQGDIREPMLSKDGAVSVLPEVAEAVRLMAQSGFFSTVFDEEQGGLQLPHLVHAAMLGILMSGNLGTASFLLLTVANARLIAASGNPKQIAAFAEPQISGAAMGTMCLSEPHAGSSLADIRTRAIPEGQDALGERFRLKGAKMWISAGDHDITDNIIHLVLAKAPDEQGEFVDGTRGISLFVAPKVLPDGQRNDIVVAGLNHKMGYRALPNAALNFGEGHFRPDGEAGAIGWMIGKPGQGLAQMFQMMNEARISVGLAGAMLANRGYLMSLDYARQRLQGRLPGSAASSDQVPIIEHADVRRMLLAQKAISQGALALVLFSARLLDDEKTAETPEAREAAASLLALLTPATKTWPSECAQTSLNDALQIHGGAGYTRDFEIELLYRDNRLNPIHEGTTGIQGLDLVGRKLRRDKGKAFADLSKRIRSCIDRIPENSELDSMGRALADALDAVETAAAMLIAEPDELRALAHGTPFLFAFGQLAVGWLWLDQALNAEKIIGSGDSSFDHAFLRGRVRTARYFAEFELPKIAAWLKPIAAGSDIVLAAPVDEF